MTFLQLQFVQGQQGAFGTGFANDGGVFVWDGAEVEDRSRGLDITQGYALALNPLVQGQMIVGTQDNGTNLLKPDVEARILDGDGFEGFFDVDVEGRLYASAYYGLLYRSDDGGRTMTNIATYLQSSGPNEVGAWQTPFQMHHHRWRESPLLRRQTQCHAGLHAHIWLPRHPANEWDNSMWRPRPGFPKR